MNAMKEEPGEEKHEWGDGSGEPEYDDYDYWYD